jgi:hypothetical protein
MPDAGAASWKSEVGRSVKYRGYRTELWRVNIFWRVRCAVSRCAVCDAVLWRGGVVKW